MSVGESMVESAAGNIVGAFGEGVESSHSSTTPTYRPYSARETSTSASSGGSSGDRRSETARDVWPPLSPTYSARETSSSFSGSSSQHAGARDDVWAPRECLPKTHWARETSASSRGSCFQLARARDSDSAQSPDWGSERNAKADSGKHIPWTSEEVEYLKKLDGETSRSIKNRMSHFLSIIRGDPKAWPIFHRVHVTTSDTLRTGYRTHVQ